MKHIILVAALSIGLGSLLTDQANAVHCGPQDVLIKGLADKYGETPQAGGLAGPNEAEMFASRDGSWSLVYTTPKGVSCIVASGKEWELRKWEPGQGAARIPTRPADREP
jgi:hypothetical protein